MIVIDTWAPATTAEEGTTYTVHNIAHTGHGPTNALRNLSQALNKLVLRMTSLIYIYIYIHMLIYVYIYIYVCMCYHHILYIILSIK